MYDSNLLFFSDTAVTTSTTSGTKAINKTPANGVTFEIQIKNVAGSTTGRTFDPYVLFSDDDSTYGDTAYLPQMTADGRVARTLQSAKKYAKMGLTVGTGTGAVASATSGVVSGPPADQVA